MELSKSIAKFDLTDLDEFFEALNIRMIAE